MTHDMKSKIEINEKYPYLYETHLHTSLSSACAKSTPEEMVRACKEYGYTGIFVTEHNWGGNTCIDRKLPWGSFVREFCKSYHRAKEEGDRIGLDVFFAYEAGYRGTEFLIYGADEEWLIHHPEIKDATIAEQFDLIHQAGGMVIHAHPFREEPYIPEIRLYPEYVDGVEAINATHSNTRSFSHNDPAFDHRAIAYSGEHHLPMTAGSDIHITSLLGGGVAFAKKLESASDYKEQILHGDYVLTNGEVWYDKCGSEIWS